LKKIWKSFSKLEIILNWIRSGNHFQYAKVRNQFQLKKIMKSDLVEKVANHDGDRGDSEEDGGGHAAGRVARVHGAEANLKY
jgi:hypothetical protein